MSSSILADPSPSWLRRDAHSRTAEEPPGNLGPLPKSARAPAKAAERQPSAHG